MPQALQLPLLCLGLAPDAANYPVVVREALRLGGCSASRALFVGACSAALAAEPPPEDWMAHFSDSKRAEATEVAHRIAALGLAPKM